MPAVLALLSMPLCGIATPASAANVSVNRCEGSDGRITYSDEACPPGSHHARTVDGAPAVEVDKGGGDRSGHPAKPGGSLQRNTVSRPVTPEQAREAASENRRTQLAQCDDLVRRIEYAQQDLLAASASERASIELSLRRLQAEHTGNCAKR